MKTFKNILVVFCSFLLLSASCKKQSKNPIDNLPPATQTGANTFGCLVNGEVWKPKGGLLDQVLDFTYDPDFREGSFGIIANRYLSINDKMELRIGGTGINKVGNYNLTALNNNVIYRDTKNSCQYIDNITLSGTLSITRYDLQAKIISGTFNFKLEKIGCPTISATEGRFDLRK